MSGYHNEHGFLYKSEVWPTDPLPTLESPSDQLAAELWHASGSGNVEEVTHIPSTPPSYANRFQVKRICTAHQFRADETKLFFDKHTSRSFLQHAFQAATQYKQPLVLEFLFGLGAKPTKRDLGRMGMDKSVDVLKLFVKQGVDLDQYVKEGYTPFMWACDHDEMFEVFLAQGVDLNGGAQYAEGRNIRRTPLDTLAGSGKVDLLKKLTARGADAKLAHALPIVAENCHLIGMAQACEIAEHLLGLGCDVNQMYPMSATYGPGRALHYAARCKDGEPLIELLIKYGADSKAVCALNRTPLDWAEHKKTSTSRKEELLSNARGGPAVSPNVGTIYERLDWMPITGIWDEEGEIRPEIVEECVRKFGAKKGILSRLSSIFSRG